MKKLLNVVIVVVTMAFLWLPAILFLCTNIDRRMCAIMSAVVVIFDMAFWKWLDRG